MPSLALAGTLRNPCTCAHSYAMTAMFASLRAAGLAAAVSFPAAAPLATLAGLAPFTAAACAFGCFTDFTGAPVHTLRGIFFSEPTNACADRIARSASAESAFA
jgi:hypothetical protein